MTQHNKEDLRLIDKYLSDTIFVKESILEEGKSYRDVPETDEIVKSIKKKSRAEVDRSFIDKARDAFSSLKESIGRFAEKGLSVIKNVYPQINVTFEPISTVILSVTLYGKKGRNRSSLTIDFKIDVISKDVDISLNGSYGNFRAKVGRFKMRDFSGGSIRRASDDIKESAKEFDGEVERSEDPSEVEDAFPVMSRGVA